MACALADTPDLDSLYGNAESPDATSHDDLHANVWLPAAGDYSVCPTAEIDGGDDPFDDFEDDDFDDEFDDDFEEDWEDDLTEDDEFPDTFGGNEPDGPDEEESPFSDDPDFDED